MRRDRATTVAALVAALLVAAAGGSRAAPALPGEAAPPQPAAAPTVPPAAVAQQAGVTVVPLRHLDARAAALLMSGRRGGGLEAALAVGVPEGPAEARRLPYWLELRGDRLATSGAVGARKLQAFAYVLDERGEVGAFSGAAIQLDLETCGERLRASGARLHGTVALPATARMLRFLLRDLASDAFVLDEVALTPFSTGVEGAAGMAVFSPSPTEWVEVRVLDPVGVGAAVGVAPTRAAAAARPVVPSPGRARFELIGNAALGRVERLHGRIVDARGVATPVASLDVVERREPEDGLVRLVIDWLVPALAPGVYTLELAAAGGEGEPPVARARLVAWPAADVGALSSWAALPATEPPSPEPGLDALSPGAVADAADADQLRARYLGALRKLAAGDVTGARNDVVALERDALAPGSSWPPTRLVRLELGVARSLTRTNPKAVVPLLMLHGEVAHDRLAVGDTAGTQRALSVAVELIRQRSIDDADPATRVAAGETAAELADTFFALGAPADTRALLERARDLAPDSVPVAIALASAYEVTGDYWRVVATLGPLLERVAAPIELRLRLGVNLRRVDRPDPAAAALKACSAPGQPTWVRVLATEELALLQIDRGRSAEALAILDDGLAALPDEPSLLVLLAWVSEQAGRVTRTRRILQQLDRIAAAGPPESPRLRYARWSTEQLQGEHDRALQVASEHLPVLATALGQLDTGSGG